jgi:hypothetical protein
VDAQVQAAIDAKVDAALARIESTITGTVKAEVTRQTTQTSGPQAGGSGSGATVNIGQIDGLTTIIALAVLGGLGAYLWRRCARWKTISDVLITDNNTAGLTKPEKDRITLAAASKGVAELLDKQVQKLKPK